LLSVIFHVSVYGASNNAAFYLTINVIFLVSCILWIILKYRTPKFPAAFSILIAFVSIMVLNYLGLKNKLPDALKINSLEYEPMQHY